MKKQYVRWAATAVCVLAAGICYSCGGASGRGDAAGARTLSLTQDSAEAAPAEDAEDAVPDESAEDAGPGESPCFVHICGEVVSPGVYELAAGSRIFEAVEKAGGFTDGAAVSYLNLAQQISDGMKIVVPSERELEEAAANGLPGAEESVAPSSGPDKVNINTAGREELMTLRGIGETRAEDIIRYREENGPFQSIEDIMNVSGIKEAAFEKIKEDITV